MTKLLGLHPEGGADGTTFLYPGSSVSRCPNPTEGYQTNPTVNGLLGATKVMVESNPRGYPSKRNPQHRGMMYNDYAGRTIHARNYWKLGSFPNEVHPMPIDTYSCRFYHTPRNSILTALTGGDQFPHLITFMLANGIDYTNDATTDRFSMMLSNVTTDFTYEYRDRPFVKHNNNTNLVAIAPANKQMNSTKTWRVQIQVQPTASPYKVTIKIWEFDNVGAPWYTMECNPTEVSMDTIMLGRHSVKCSSGYVTDQWIGDLEVWNSYDLDGQVDLPYEPPKHKFFEMVSGIETPVIEEGVMSAGSVDTVDKENWTEGVVNREYVYDTSNFVYVSQIRYDDISRPIRSGSLWYPSRPAPPDGWKVIVIVHGGFFSAGTRHFLGQDDPMWMIKMLLRLGYAVFTIDYIYAWQLSLFDFPKPAWPEQGSAFYPTFIVDIKLALLWVEEQSTYPLDGANKIVCGHSAGAYLAQAAAISQDMNNHEGKDLTVNSAWGYRTATPDPSVLGAYGWATPSDMQWAYDNDVTHPEFGPKFDYNKGSLKVTANLFYGKAYTYNLTNADSIGSSLSEMVTAQDSLKIPLIGLMHGMFDGVVPPEHIFMYEDALALKGVTVSSILTNRDHDTSLTHMPEHHFKNFLEMTGMSL